MYHINKLINAVDEAIQFTYEINFLDNKVNFLDTTIQINEEGLFTTDLYFKLNTLNQYFTTSAPSLPTPAL